MQSEFQKYANQNPTTHLDTIEAAFNLGYSVGRIEESQFWADLNAAAGSPLKPVN